MNLTLTSPPLPVRLWVGQAIKSPTLLSRPILNSSMKIILPLMLLFLIAVIDFFSGGGGRREGDC